MPFGFVAATISLVVINIAVTGLDFRGLSGFFKI